jgi:hypothetical protein
MPRDECVEGGLGCAACEFGEQFVVVQFGHLTNDVRRTRNWTNYFATDLRIELSASRRLSHSTQSRREEQNLQLSTVRLELYSAQLLRCADVLQPK